MDLDYIRQRFRDMPDEELEKEINQNGNDYTEEALRIAKAELENRNFLKPKEVKKKRFKTVINDDPTNFKTVKWFFGLAIIVMYFFTDIFWGFNRYGNKNINGEYQQNWFDSGIGAAIALLILGTVIIFIISNRNGDKS